MAAEQELLTAASGLDSESEAVERWLGPLQQYPHTGLLQWVTSSQGSQASEENQEKSSWSLAINVTQTSYLTRVQE